jgi:hypothetical protein
LLFAEDEDADYLEEYLTKMKKRAKKEVRDGFLEARLINVRFGR